MDCEDRPNTPPEQGFACPHCGSGADAPLGAQPQVVTCTQCGKWFVLPALDGSVPLAAAGAEGRDEGAAEASLDEASSDDAFVVDDTTVRAQDEELDGIRIRQIAALRRATARGRSHSLVLAGVCAVGAVQFLLMFVRQVKGGGRGVYEASLLVVAVALGIFTVHFWRRAAELHRELRRSGLAEPTAPPDFSPLSDGSQRYRNLEDVQ